MKKLLGFISGLALLVAIGLTVRFYQEGIRSQTMVATEVAALQCPDRPSCVSSLEKDRFYIAPLLISSAKFESDITIDEISSALIALGLINIKITDSVLHAEAQSQLFGFIDDVDILIPQDGSNIWHIRSVSRVGYSDLGVNRDRIELLRQYLQDRNLMSEND